MVTFTKTVSDIFVWHIQEFTYQIHRYLTRNGDIFSTNLGIKLILVYSIIITDHFLDSIDTHFSTDIFAASELRGVLGKNAIESKKSLYDLVVVDSEGVEMDFANSLENEDDVVVYTKLPRDFYISTPMGKYNPDWAVAFKEGTVKHIYLVAETKGNSLDPTQLRGAEDAKIKCAQKHFESIGEGDVVYTCVKTYKELYDAIAK